MSSYEEPAKLTGTLEELSDAIIALNKIEHNISILALTLRAESLRLLQTDPFVANIADLGSEIADSIIAKCSNNAKDQAKWIGDIKKLEIPSILRH